MMVGLYIGGRYAPLMEQGEYMYHQRIYKDYLKAIAKTG